MFSSSVGGEGFNQFALVSVFLCAVRDLATRRIPAQVPSPFITLVTTLMVTIAGAAIIVPLGGWTQPSPRALGLLTLAAVLVTGASIIVLSGLYAFYRERIRHRPGAADASGLPRDGL